MSGSAFNSTSRRRFSPVVLARLALVCVMVATVVGSVGLSTPAAAQQYTRFWGYLLADQESAADYTPDLAYQHNPSGDNMTVHRIDVGAYDVAIPVPVEPGNVQVTAVGETANTCSLESWIYATETNLQSVWIKCWDVSGAPADTKFSLLFSIGVIPPPSAYLTAESSTLFADFGPNDYEPRADSQFNAGGGTNKVAQSTIGVYEVTLPGLGPKVGGNVQVSPVTTAEGARNTCTATSRTAVEADLKIVVSCFDVTGAPSDTVFTLAFFDDTADTTASTGAYVSTDATNPAQISTTGGATTVTMLEPGNYKVTVDNAGTTQTSYGNFHVTTLTPDAYVFCSLFSLDVTPPAAVANVQCVDAAGTRVEAGFTLLWVRA